MQAIPTSDTSLIEALSQKRNAIQGQITSLKSEMKRLSGGMDHIDATIALIRGDKDVPIKHRVNRNFKPNECKTAILDLLRTAPSPMDTKEISLSISDQAKNKIEPDGFRHFQKSIGATLRRLEGKGLVRSTGKDGLLILWEIAN